MAQNGRTHGALLSSEQVDAYLQRIGVATPLPPTLDTLRKLHAAHQRAVPFENLSVHLQEQASVDAVQSAYAKVVGRRRGGFCYDLNSLFAALLAALGFQACILAGRVNDPNRDMLGALFDHLVVRVELEGRQWLADVGFGRFAEAPLDLGAPGEQHDRCGTFALQSTDAGDLDVLHDGKLIYQVETRPRPRSDFAPHCWWHTTHPASVFTQARICSVVTDTGRITLSGGAGASKLITTSDSGERSEQQVDDTAALRALRDHFGIVLDHMPPVLHPAEKVPEF